MTYLDALAALDKAELDASVVYAEAYRLMDAARVAAQASCDCATAKANEAHRTFVMARAEMIANG